MIDRMGLRPENVLFLDDNPMNLAGGGVLQRGADVP